MGWFSVWIFAVRILSVGRLRVFLPVGNGTTDGLLTVLRRCLPRHLSERVSQAYAQ
jgi:hypothetical protein